MMKILAIETSCDETAIALVEAEGRLPAGRQGLRAPRFKVLKNIISSQIEIHRPWGGVVPNLAKREHTKNLPVVLRQVFGNSKFEARNSKSRFYRGFPTRSEQIQNNKSKIPKIDLLAVTVGPGLEPCLWSGIEFTKEIHKNYFPKAKLIGVNHLEGHLYSFLLEQKTEISNYKSLISKSFPAVALIVSGGHTILLKMDSLTKWKKLGETRDDAVGEAFDKVAKMFELPYPGGPEIQKLAEHGNPDAIPFPRPMLHSKDYNFSFSGLKTSVLYYLRDAKQRICPNAPKKIRKSRGSDSFVDSDVFAGWDRNQADIAASFQQAAVDVLVKKTERAAREFKAKSILLSGGVAANKLLRENLQTTSHKLQTNFFAPPMNFNTDNAVMIAVAGYISHLQKKNKRLIAQGNMSI